MALLTRWCVAVAAACALGSSGRAQPVAAPDTSLDGAVGQANFIFVGTVRRVGPATEDLLPARFAALVTVDTAVRAPASVGALEDAVTITLMDTVGVIAGRKYVIYAAGLSADSTLVLNAVAVRPASSDPNLVGNLVAATRAAAERIADRRYWARYQSAEIVVLGVVRAIGSDTASTRDIQSEHAPLWRRAAIRVDTVLKGPSSLQQSGFSVLFPTSGDFRYGSLTPLQQGQLRLLTLRPLSDLPARFRAGLDTTRTYVVLDSLDNLAASDVIRASRRR